jgi:hypothetical protein
MVGITREELVVELVVVVVEVMELEAGGLETAMLLWEELYAEEL